MTATARGGERVAICLAAAVNAASLYPPKHPRVAAAVEELRDSVGRACETEDGGELTLLVIGEELVVDGEPLRSGGYSVESCREVLHDCGVEGVSFRGTPDVEELLSFVVAVAGRTVPEDSRSIDIGYLRAGFERERGEDDDGGAERASELDLDAAGREFLALREDGDGVEAMAVMIADLARLGDVGGAAVPLPALGSFEDDAFAHGATVAHLTMGLARGIGIRGRRLEEIGLAALLHDVGKLTLPPTVFRSRGPVSDAEWDLVRRHPALGAAILCELPAAPPVAVVVAFEHHLRHDGEPSYPALAEPRRPNLASAMTAVADTYDVVRTASPGTADDKRRRALDALRHRAGTFLDPELVEVFTTMIGHPDRSRP